MANSHYTLDRLSPSSSSSESGVAAGGAKVNRIRVQPHHVSQDKKPILDYDSNDDFEQPAFDDSDTFTGGVAIRQFEDFNDFAASPEEGLMEDFTIVTQDNSGRFPQATKENSVRFSQATQENTVQKGKVTQENTGRYPPAIQENTCHFTKVTPLNSKQFSQVTGGQNGMRPIGNIAISKTVIL
jgi:hypothetical protein